MKILILILIFYFVFPSLNSQSFKDLDFLNQMIDNTKYNLKKNYGKGCLLSRGQDFREAKRFLKKLYIIHHPVSFYCGCKIVYSKRKRKLLPEISQCGYKRKSKSTKIMINWEHVMPASRFGKNRICWKKKVCSKFKKGKWKFYKGRKCCNAMDPCFNTMEGDVHNLVPSIYELNRDRRNYFFGEIWGEPRKYGQCDFEIHKKIVEPRENIRGDIARIYLYMSWFYGIPLTFREKQWIQKWNRLDPPSLEEKRLNRLKARYRGNENPFISYYRAR